MKLDAIVEPALGEIEKTGGRHWHFGGEDGAFDSATGGLEEDADVLHRGSDDVGGVTYWQLILPLARRSPIRQRYT